MLEIFVKASLADQAGAAYQLKSDGSKEGFNSSKRDKIQRIRSTARAVQLMAVQFVIQTARRIPVDVAHSSYIILSVNWAGLTPDGRYGWCGNTPGHCLVANGCQSGCTDGSGGNAGGGAQPTTTGEPVIGGMSATMPASVAATGAATTDGESSLSRSVVPQLAGTRYNSILALFEAMLIRWNSGTCGAANGNTVCGNWPNGNCCSMYGFW